MALYFKAGNDVMGDMHIDDIDFLVRDDNEEVVDHPLPDHVMQAIQVLRRYGAELEALQ